MPSSNLNIHYLASHDVRCPSGSNGEDMFMTHWRFMSLAADQKKYGLKMSWVTLI